MRNFRRNSAALFIAVLMLLSFCFGAERVQADESRDYLRYGFHKIHDDGAR